jgi:transcription antitermination factor NusG
MANNEFVENKLMTNDGLMVGDDVTSQSMADIDRARIDCGFKLAVGHANRRWMVLMCRTGSELMIRDELENREIEVFAPKKDGGKVRIRNRYMKRPDRAVFGGYVFINIPHLGAVIAALGSIKPAYGLLMVDENPMVVPISNMLKMMANDEAGVYGRKFVSTHFDWVVPGIRVTITDGAFEEMPAIVNRVTNGNVELYVDIMGRKTKTTLPLDLIEKRN